VRLEGLGHYLIGNRTRDLPACSTVPPSALIQLNKYLRIHSTTAPSISPYSPRHAVALNRQYSITTSGFICDPAHEWLFLTWRRFLTKAYSFVVKYFLNVVPAPPNCFSAVQFVISNILDENRLKTRWHTINNMSNTCVNMHRQY
jgi:hypothetical protein